MLTDSEILHLQRSIAFHRSKQVEVIASRDAVISNLQFDVKNMNSVILKHRDEYAIIKEKLVKVMTEFEMRGILLDAEKQKNSVSSAAVDLKENSLVIARQEIEFLRKQLAETEGLLTLGSQQRNKVQELETSLLHSREQIRLLTDNKSSSDSQLHSSGRELEDSKFKCASAEMKIELTLKEKSFLSEEISELKQQLAKSRALSAEELSEVKRELLKTKDSVESERILRTKLESIGESVRAKDMEEYRCRAEIQQREMDARSPVPTLEREKDKLSSQLDALREALEAKEAERSLECEKSRTLNSQIAKLLLDLETSKGLVEEARGRYNAVRAEGRYARQKVLESVGFVIDILSVAGVGETDPTGAQNENPLLQQNRAVEGTSSSNAEASLTNSMGVMRKAQRALLMLSPRAKDSIRAQLGPVQVPGLGGDASIGGNIMNPLRLFSDDTVEGGGSQGGLSIGPSLGGAAHDPFDLPILYGLTDALCLPDLRSVLQTLRDHMERVLSAQAASISNIDTEMRQRVERVERDKNIALVSELEAAEKAISSLQRDLDTQRRKGDDLNITIAQMERNMELERQRKMDMELERSQRFAAQNDVRLSQTFRDGERGRGREDFQMGSSMRKEKEWDRDSVLFDDDMRMSSAFNQIDKVQDMDVLRVRSEYKNTITEMSRRHEAEKGMLAEEVGMLKERVSTLISQNKDCNSYFGLTVPVPCILAGDDDVSVRADCNAESDEENRMIKNPLALALTSERANSSTLSARLDAAKETISYLTAQVSANAGVCEELDSANEMIASLTSQMAGEGISEGSPAVSEGRMLEIESLRSKLKWTCKHHTVMCRAILQLERELKAQSDENALTINLGRGDRLLSRYDDRDRPRSRSRSRSRSQSASRSASGSPFEDGQSVALQAEQKLRLRSMIRGKIVGIYRKCLFAMRDPRLSSLSDTGSRSGSGRFDSSGRVSESWGFVEEEESLSLRSEIDGDGDEYDHDRDFDLLGKTFRDLGRHKPSRYTAPPRDRERDRERDSSMRNRSSVSVSQSQDGVGSYPGPRLCQWLDKELASLRGTYEGEIRTLEDIITNLRELLRETDRVKKVKRKAKSPSSKTVSDRMRQSDVFVVRHVDDERVGLRSSTKTFFNSTY